MVIRLIDWVQAGQPLHEGLLASGVLSSDYVYSQETNYLLSGSKALY